MVAQVTGRAIALAFELALIPVQGFAKLIADIKAGNWGKVLKFDPSGFDKIGAAFDKAFQPLGSYERPDRSGSGGAFRNRPLENEEGTGTGTGSKSRASAKAAERAAEQAAKQLQSSQDLLDVLNQQMKIQETTEGFAKIAAEYELEVLQLNQDYRDSIADAVTEQERLNLEKAKGLELDILRDKKRQDQFSLAQDEFNVFMSNEKELNTELTQTQELLKGAYDIVAGGLQSGIQGLIDGSKELNDVFGDILNQLASMAMQMAFKSLGAGIGVPGMSFEGGGYTGNAARSGGLDGQGGFLAMLHPQETVIDHYGDAADAMGAGSGSFEESGEALEMATAQGYAASSESMEMATAQGYAASGEALQAATAARGGNTSAALAGAIQAFADSGSAMAAASSNRSSNSAAAAQASALQTAESYFSTGKSTVTFDTYRVGEMDVVTREDAMKIGMESAKKAEANVYKGLRNMPAVRGRSGVK